MTGNSKKISLRNLPSVDQLLGSKSVVDLIEEYGRTLTLQALRDVLDNIRVEFRKTGEIPDEKVIIARAAASLVEWTASTLIPVVNASGVILHTNLGRAPLSKAAILAASQVAKGYSNLEYDLGKGRRGSRLVHAEELLTRLTSAEAAVVVNNNAAAVMLVLSALARRRKVVIARSQLIEIGGGFRIPDVMKQSGARLLEVGTTNRVHVSDYENALEEKPALFMRAHRSNFRLIGFTSEPTLPEIVSVSSRAGVPLVDDIGSGALLDTSQFGLGHEPMVQDSLAEGADLVCFSGDKLLGGPQAGIVLGKASLIGRLKKHPLARALRADKLCLAALSATLTHYLKGEALAEIPIWRMIAAQPEQIHARAASWRKMLGQGEVIEAESTVGGGSLPGEILPTYVLAIEDRNSSRTLSRLRLHDPPIICRTHDDQILLDPRTVLPEQDSIVISALRSLI